MSLNPRSIRLPWVAGALLIVGSIGLAAHLMQDGTPVAGKQLDPTSRSRENAGQGVVCLGKVDVESGILPLRPLQPGSIVEILCFEGQQVREGAALLKVNTEPFINIVAGAEAGVKVAEAKMAQAQQALEQHNIGLKGKQAVIDGAKAKLAAANADLRTAEKAITYNNTQLTKEDVEKARQQVEGAKALVTGAEADYEQFKKGSPQALINEAARSIEVQKAKLAQANEQMKRCTLRAPKDGVVLQLLASMGSQFGQQSHQPALYFAPDGQRVVRAEVAQEFAGRISLGALARIHDDSNAGPELQGKVMRISDAFLPPRNNISQDLLSSGSTNAVLEVLVSIDPPANGIMPKLQQRMRVTIEGTRR